jgi:DNA-binding MarR family transcriptional regulator
MEDKITELFREISQRFRAEMRYAPEVGRHRPTPFQNELIVSIGRMPGTSVMEMADLTGRDKAQVTRVVAELESQGLINRTPSPLDRRSVQLRLTGDGEAIFHAILEKRRALSAKMLRSLSEEERSIAFTLLRKMRSGLEG